MRVAILCFDGRTRPDQDRPLLGTPVSALLEGLSALELDVHVVSCSQVRIERSESLWRNVTIHSLHVPKWGWLRSGYLGCVLAVRRKLTTLQPAVVHAHGTERWCAMAGAMSGFPAVLTIHGIMRKVATFYRSAPWSLPWLQAQIESAVIPLFQGVICISRYVRSAVDVRARKTWLVPNAISSRWFAARKLKSEVREIVFVGDIAPHKNQIAFLEAVTPLAEDLKIKLIFCGYADNSSEYVRRFFHTLKGAPWASYEGMLGQEQLRHVVSRATISVLPSLEESFGMAVIESMACGTPVIATNRGGVPDIIQDGENGLLVDPLDSASMKDAIQRLLDQPKLAGELAKQAESDARSRYFCCEVARRHESIYREIAEGRK